MRKIFLPWLVVFVLIGLAASLKAANSSEITVEKAWARASIGTLRPAAVYFTVTNGSNARVSLDRVTTPVASKAVIHATIKDGAIVRMRPVGKFDVLAGESLVLKPGGMHLMLMNLKLPLIRGGTFPLILHFNGGRSITVTVPIMDIGAKGLK